MEPVVNVSESAACCDVLACASVRVAAAELDGLRKNPGPALREPLPNSLLKHADDQTVAGMAAVLHAIAGGGLSEQRFTEWCVLAAPRFLGRAMMAQALQRFAAEGAWGMSPHLIPHRSLHSVSGTVSQALKIHGPNLGVGGGPGGVLEVLRTAAAMLHGDRLPGVWIVLTGWDPEPQTGGASAPSVEARCVGVALALTQARANWRGTRLRLVPGEPIAQAQAARQPMVAPNFLELEALISALSTLDARAAAIVWQLESGWRLELERDDAPRPLAGPHAWPAAGGRVPVGSGGAGAENPR